MLKILLKPCGLYFSIKNQMILLFQQVRTTVKNFINLVSKELQISLKWKGKGLKEKAVDKNGNTIVSCDKAYYRPLEVNNLLGDSKKASCTKILGWKPEFDLKELISDMIKSEMQKISS